ncbi:type IV pilus biogenesis protein PilQ [Vibrio astriarenae]|nr:type IV pilus biogenesis protein PilQ [Vibrio sp. C7]
MRNVLQLIADYNDFNLVVSDSVAGNLTLRLMACLAAGARDYSAGEGVR